MRGRHWPQVLGLACIVAATLVCALVVAAGLWRSDYASAAGLAFLSAGLVLVLVQVSSRAAALEGKVAAQNRSLRTIAAELDIQARAMADIEDRAFRGPAAKVHEVQSDLRDLRQSVQDLQERLEQPPPEDVDPPKPASEQLELLLEPLVEIAIGMTAHYRAQLHMINEAVGEVAHNELMAKAEKGGMRPPLDLHMLKKVIPVLRRLRVKHQARSIFVPLGSSTLTSKDDLDAILRLLEVNPDVTAGLVFEIAHAQLAALTGEGIEGLARVARLGAQMALSHVTIVGLDLASLRQLGVRYLDVDGGSMDAGFGIAPTWFEFAELARSMQFQIVAGGVVTPVHAAAAAKIARYAHGPFFAPPRKVRANAESAPVHQRSQAA